MLARTTVEEESSTAMLVGVSYYYAIAISDQISISTAWSYLMVGITELINFKNIMSAW